MPRTPSHQAEGRRRSLNTARAALRVLAYLVGRHDGATTGEISRILGKSSYTAYYLLNSLCQEGFAYRDRRGRYRLSAPWNGSGPGPNASPQPSLDALRDALNELNAVTGCRAYLVVYDGHALLVEGVRGRQGQLGVKGVRQEIRAEAHALAVGKAVLAQLSEGALQAYIQFERLPRFTPHTITDPAEIRAELARVSQEGLAFDREEHEEGINCIATPVSAIDKGQQLIASLGIAVPSGRFKVQGNRLVEMVREVASHVGAAGQHGGAADGGEHAGSAERQATGRLAKHRLPA
jgi:DNA-binding IclR family transcriptional regulator